MFYFGGISDSCATILGVIYFIRELLNIVCFFIPMILILMLSLDFLKGVISFDDGSKKVMNYVIKRILYAVVIFLLPSTVFALFNILGVDASDSNSCWTYVGEASVEEVKEISEAKEKALEDKITKLQEEQSQKLYENNNKLNSIKEIVDLKYSDDSEEDIEDESDGKIVLDWDNLTKTSGLSGNKLKATLNKIGGSYKKFSQYATHLVKMEKKYKVNVFFLIGLEAHESGWITSRAAKKCNNLGGVKYTGKSGTTECSGSSYAKYSSIKAFMESHASLLGNKYLKKSGSYYHGTAIEDVKKEYCPESSCSEWISNTKSIGNKIYKKAKTI